MVTSLLLTAVMAQTPALGKAMPDVALTDMNGATVRLSSFRGKKLILFNWASWCGCRAQLPGWQSFVELNRNRGFVFVAVAMDAGGIDACKPHYRFAKATYVQLVDSGNELGDALGFRVVPNGFLVDEAGVLKAQRIGGFEVSSPATLKMIEDFLSQPKATQSANAPAAPSFAELRRAAHETRSPESRLAYGKELLNRKQHWEALPHLRDAASKLTQSTSAQFALGSCLLAIGQKAEATASLRKALKLDPENYVIRKQIWVIEHPERFHPEIDWAWQREQLAKERGSGG